MNVVIIGLGHVGSLVAADLLRAGHSVVGVDRDPRTLERFAQGIAPFREEGVAQLIAAGHAEGRTTAAPVLRGIDAEAIFVCVSTRGATDGSLDTSDIVATAREIGNAMRDWPRRASPVQIVFCSTMLPGTMSGIVVPEMTRSAGAPAGTDYEIAYWPEFSREGSAISDRSTPSRIVVGERVSGTASILRQWLAGSEVPVYFTSFEVAELVKMADNAFHALKISFANELGRLSVASGISAEDVSAIFRADTKLNTSDAYLRPGFAYGGPCLPKDVRALSAHMRMMGVDAPVIGHIEASNHRHLRFSLEEILCSTKAGSRILLVGLSFKSGVDDLRGSPFISLARELLDRNYDLSIYDPDVDANALSDFHSELGPLLTRLVTRVSESDSWDKVIIGKCGDGGIPADLYKFPILRLDRL